jgi:hypothetical protein
VHLTFVWDRGRGSEAGTDERREVRDARSRPLLASVHEWLEASLAKLSMKSDTSAAIRYARAGTAWCASEMMAALRSTTTAPSVRCVPWRLAGRITYLLDRIAAGIVPQPPVV